MARTAQKRAYDGRLRTLQAGRRRDAILEIALGLFMERSYEDVTLQVIADAADVALKTVVRQFGTKDALFIECVRQKRVDEFENRRVEPGDIRGAAHILADRYEEMGDMTMRYLSVESRFDSVREMLTIAREFHVAWLTRVFAEWLPVRDTAERRVRVAQLFAATEIFVWWVLRNRLGMDRKTAEAAMRGTLTSLVASWSKENT